MTQPLEVGAVAVMQDAPSSGSLSTVVGTVASGVGGIPTTKDFSAHAIGNKSVFSKPLSAVLQAGTWLWGAILQAGTWLWGAMTSPFYSTQTVEEMLIAYIHGIETSHATSVKQVISFYHLLRRGRDVLDEEGGVDSQVIAMYLRRGYDELSSLIKQELDSQLSIASGRSGGTLVKVGENTDLSNQTVITAVFTLYQQLPSVALERAEAHLSTAKVAVDKISVLKKMLTIKESPLEPDLHQALIKERIRGAFQRLPDVLREEIEQSIKETVSCGEDDVGACSLRDDPCGSRVKAGVEKWLQQFKQPSW